MDDMNNYGSWAEGSRCYESLMVVVDMNDSRLWAQGSRSYEQLRVVVNMNKSSCEHRL